MSPPDSHIIEDGNVVNLQVAYDDHPLGVCVLQGNRFHVRYANAPARSALGVARSDESIIGKSLKEILGAVPDGAGLLSTLRRSLTIQGVPIQKHGEPHGFWDVQARRIALGDGRPAVLVELSDATERVRQGGQSLGELKALLHSMQGAVFVFRDGQCIRTNAAATRLLAVSTSEILGAGPYELLDRFHVEFLDGRRATPEALLRSPRRMRRLRWVQTDGAAVVASFTITPFHIPGDSQRSFVCIVRNETRQWRARTDRRTALRHRDAVIDHIPVGVRIWHSSGRLIRENRAAREIMGAAAPTLEEEYARVLTIGGAPPEYDHAPSVAALHSPGPVIERKVTYRRVDGGIRHLSVRSVPLPSGGDAAHDVVTVVFDTTADQRQQLLRDRFAAVLSHELRNPIAAASLNMQAAARALAQSPPEDPARVQQYVAQSMEYVARVASVLDVLVRAVRPANTDAPGRCALDLAALCQRVSEVASSEDPARVYRWDCPQPVRVRSDAPCVEQILTILLNNARKYSAAGSEVLIRAEPEAAGARVEVWDEGVGVPGGEEELVFEQFYRASNVVGLAGHPGLGLGLFLARTLVTQLGGSIGVRRRPAAGSVFWFTVAETA